MMLPHRHQVDFARRKGNVPYPCYYCMNYVKFGNVITDEHNHVISFGEEANVPCTCMAGLTAPTEKDDCKGIQILELPQFYRRWYSSALFDRFTREYYMEMLTDIRCGQPITRSRLIGRAHKGYHTREQRIDEMLDEGVIYESINVQNEPTYSLTAYGDEIAEGICQMLDEYIIIKEKGEMLHEPVHEAVFLWLRKNPDSTIRAIYDYFEDTIAKTLDDLINAGYIEPMFDDDFIIRYNVTQKGIDVWTMLNKEKEEERSRE